MNTLYFARFLLKRIAAPAALVFALLGSIAGHAGESVPSLARLPPHPRLFADDARWAELRAQVEADPVSARMARLVRARAEQVLTLPPVRYEKNGRRLLRPVREGSGRIIALAMTARLGGEERFRVRAIEDMRLAATLPDWNPSHFLDTAEMTFGLAIGYDWLYEWIAPADRALFERAIREKGLVASFPEGPEPGWVDANNNWTQVCHSGLAAGAIAVAALDPELSTRVLQRALDHLPGSARFAYEPDGAYPEGPSYWDYGTTYHALLADLLQHALGSTLGTDGYPGFLETARYLDQMTGPTGTFFNYADGREPRGFSPALFWFARRLHDGALLRHELAQIETMPVPGGDEQGPRFLPFALLWWNPSLEPAARSHETAAPLSWLGRGKTPVAVHRSAWGDPRALFVGLKAGPINASHAHMDVGSFIIEGRGVRWAVDPGWQDYSALEARGLDLWAYGQNADRWNVFRLGSEAHNILRFNGRPQDVGANVPITDFSGAPGQQSTTLDLSSAYPGLATRAHRTVTLEGDTRILIEDTWTTGDRPVDAAWQWLTRAEASLVTDGVQLAQAGQTLRLRVLAPAEGWTFTIEETDGMLQPHDEPNPGLRRIVLHTRTAARATGRIRVAVEPVDPKP